MADSVASEQLFQIMRFQILTFALSAKGKRLTDAYVYAWDSGVYPFAENGADWHQPFNNQFRITEQMMDELTKYLDQRWRAKDFLTYYQLEEYFGGRTGRNGWDRSALMSACRYLFLSELFDQEFWQAFLAPGQYPTEGETIMYKFDRQKMYLM